MMLDFVEKSPPKTAKQSSIHGVDFRISNLSAVQYKYSGILSNTVLISFRILFFLGNNFS